MKRINWFQAVAAILLLALFVFPLWRITLKAPQYPDGISMYIWINKITGESEYTLQNINILNHYVGMKNIVPDEFPEFDYFPIIIIAMTVLGLGASLNKKAAFSWLVILIVLGCLGIYDFYLWEYEYGHNLSPTAPIKIPGMAYQPPLIGSKMLLNFEATSWPYWGGLFLGMSILLSGFSIFIKRKK